MARLRKFVCYRHLERPNTRKSKYRNKSFVRGAPVCRIVKFNIGNLSDDFPYRLDLAATQDMQVRDNSIESARLTTTRTLEKALGKKGFRIQVRTYPHHILREHALASGAGADRFSSGMAHSFGKPVGNAVQLKNGQKLMSVYVPESGITLAREALNKANCKLPAKFSISVEKL
ncbi:50S ribosomal protein L16 [Candidatus Woesearchaeota archaeon]|nr:50S ribosomal protein L16 [Candidatus Woesearchaeota archaeon]